MTREPLPNRRETQTFRFDFAGIKHHCSVSNYDDGRVAEVFVDCGKVNSGVQNIMRDGAILISLALQHGCPVETLRHAMTRTDKQDEPASALGKLLDMVMENRP